MKMVSFGGRWMAGLAAISSLGVPAPVLAAPETAGVRPGGFIGARLQLNFGGQHRQKTQFAIAPTQSRISANGMVETRIGEGIALNLSPGAKPNLTIAGTRADAALGFKRGSKSDAEPTAGVSTVGWVAIGAGVLAVAGGLYFVHLVYEADKHSD